MTRPETMGRSAAPAARAVLAKLAGAPGAAADRPLRIAELVRSADPLLSAPEVDRAVDDVCQNLDGLGPIASLLADDAVTDVMVNGAGPVWIDRGHGVERSHVSVRDIDVAIFIERVLSPLGRRVDPVSPVVDARLADGSRVHVVVPPLAVDGPCITIRRFATRRISLERIAARPVAELLRRLVRERANVVVSGGTGSGKTTLLNALAAEITATERIVTVEDAAELRLPSEHVVRLETRSESVEGTPAVSARDLVRNALRMRPDRLLLGEVRGPEALDLIQAMNTGHDGSLSTVHANGCADALRRLETLVLIAGIGLPIDAVRDHLAAAIDVIVHLRRTSDGRRSVAEIAEVVPPPVSDRVRLRPLVTDGVVVAAPQRVVRHEPSKAPT